VIHRALPVALTIAGSDSGGGAGIQADLKTFHAFGVFGTSALTAVTAQNTLGVTAVHPIPVEVVRAQIDAVREDLRPAAIKTGMLATRELVVAVAEALGSLQDVPCVVDPVMVASSGHRLLDADAEEAVASRLLPRAALVTPNLREARLLTGLRIDDVNGAHRAAERLMEAGAVAALVKGGHLTGGEAVDVLHHPGGERTWRRARIDTRHTHGTGCTLSAAVAAGLARGFELEDAVGLAVDFVRRGMEQAPGLGSGHGPLNHFVPALPESDSAPGREG
jgi:hydroxymethylpyrimidine/phosphomethylpyrimidine kinase